MSSFQLNPLPEGYSLRLATEKDLFKLFYFEYFTHEPSAKKRTIGLMLLFLIMIYFVGKIDIPLYLEIITLIVPIGWSILFYFSNCIQSLVKKSLFSVWIIECKSEIHGFLSCTQHGDFLMIARLLVGRNRQNMGIGSVLIRCCINKATTPIYLECKPVLENYYYRFGFVPADLSHIPTELLPRKAYYTSPHCTLMVLDS